MYEQPTHVYQCTKCQRIFHREVSESAACACGHRGRELKPASNFMQPIQFGVPNTKEIAPPSRTQEPQLPGSRGGLALPAGQAPSAAETRQCRYCNEFKPIDEFSPFSPRACGACVEHCRIDDVPGGQPFTIPSLHAPEANNHFGPIPAHEDARLAQKAEAQRPKRLGKCPVCGDLRTGESRRRIIAGERFDCRQCEAPRMAVSIHPTPTVENQWLKAERLEKECERLKEVVRKWKNLHGVISNEVFGLREKNTDWEARIKKETEYWRNAVEAVGKSRMDIQGDNVRLANENVLLQRAREAEGRAMEKKIKVLSDMSENEAEEYRAQLKTFSDAESEARCRLAELQDKYDGASLRSILFCGFMVIVMGAQIAIHFFKN